jgi:hypothetical protein
LKKVEGGGKRLKIAEGIGRRLMKEFDPFQS